MPDSPRPVNDLETALYAAVDRGDLEAYLAILRGATVVVPAPRGPAFGPGTTGWPVMTVDGRGYLPVFTSPEAMLANPAARTKMDSVRFTLPELAERWPEPTWGLAVNPGSPIAVLLPGSFVRSTGFRLGAVDPVDALVLPDIRRDGFADIRTGTFVTDNPAEAELGRAIAGDDPRRALWALFDATLFLVTPQRDGYLVPGQPGFRWLTVDTRHGPAVPVFTSRNRVDLGLGHHTYTKLPIRLVDLAEAWPADGYPIVVNPGTSLTLHLPGPGVLGLTALARELGLDTDDDFAPGAEPDPALFDAAALALDLRHQPGAAIDSSEQSDHVLLTAAADGDREGYLKLLLGLQVRLPAQTGADPGTRYAGRPFPWLTTEIDGRTALQVFSSTAMLRGTGIRTRSGAEVGNLLRHWPNPDWDLAVNPGTPAAAILPAAHTAPLSQWHDQAVAHAFFHSFPADDRLDLQLVDAARRGDRTGLLEMLRPAKVIIVTPNRDLAWNTPVTDPAFPWDPIPLRGRPTIPVYTSHTWQSRTGGSGKTVRAAFGELAAAWPPDGPDLVVNPASPISVTMTAAEIRAFAT